MKKLSFLILFSILLLIFKLNDYVHHTYRALKIDFDNGTKVGIDINDNDKISEGEYFPIKDIITFSSEEELKNAEKKLGTFTEKEKIYFLKNVQAFYKTYFLNSKIRFKEDEIFVNNEKACLVFLKKGFAIAANEKYRQYENRKLIENRKKEANKYNYVLFNTKNHVYHELDCFVGKKSINKDYIVFDELPKGSKPCAYCHKLLKKGNNISKQEKYEKDKQHDFVKSYGAINVFTEIGANIYKPSPKCDNNTCTALLKEINNAKREIDIAIYDLNQPVLLSALEKASERGVKIRFVSDDGLAKDNQDDYKKLSKLSIVLLNDSFNKKYSSRLMHNKFIIFDKQKVWTGTANITNTGLSGFNSNISILINSKEIAEIYEKEFQNFLDKKFHADKSKIHKSKVSIGQVHLEIFFSPKDSIIDKEIIPCVKNAKKCIYVPSFIITHKDFAKELVNAKKRGVDVKVITDAVSARNKYSSHSYLRNNNVDVKVENFAGKMHIKALIIDDNIVFVGSMNHTKSGNSANDENVLKIENPQIAMDMNNIFWKIWNKIPDKYLKNDPRAESFESIGSCFDGIDNDYDGKIDALDSSCKFR